MRTLTGNSECFSRVRVKSQIRERLDKRTRKSTIYTFYLFGPMEPQYDSVYEISRDRTCAQV